MTVLAVDHFVVRDAHATSTQLRVGEWAHCIDFLSRCLVTAVVFLVGGPETGCVPLLEPQTWSSVDENACVHHQMMLSHR